MAGAGGNRAIAIKRHKAAAAGRGRAGKTNIDIINTIFGASANHFAAYPAGQRLHPIGWQGAGRARRCTGAAIIADAVGSSRFDQQATDFAAAWVMVEARNIAAILGQAAAAVKCPAITAAAEA